MEDMQFTLINNAEIAHPEWRFLQGTPEAPSAEWAFFRQNPQNLLEKLVQKPKISRYRASIQAAMHAHRCRHPVLISHMPRTTAWTAQMATLTKITAPHLAFSFNFTDLPHGRPRSFMARTFQRVDRFVVYSTFERGLYSDWFGIDPERIDVLKWAMDIPVTDNNAIHLQCPYICAAGGEGRDYGVLMQAMRRLPHIQLVVIARPHNLKDLQVPDNVRVFTNLPSNQYWSLVANSAFTLVPLNDDQKANGHITIVGAYLLGKTVIGTESRGTQDYLVHEQNSLTTPANDPVALAERIQRLHEDKALLTGLSANAQQFAQDHCQVTCWNRYLKNYLADIQ